MCNLFRHKIVTQEAVTQMEFWSLLYVVYTHHQNQTSSKPSYHPNEPNVIVLLKFLK